MLKVLLVDDEVASLRTLEMLLEQLSNNLQVIDVARSASEAVEKVRVINPDIVFLDIEMPGGSGFDFLEKSPNNDFDVIFVTAYNNYAVKAFKFCAIDYLLKPIDFDELSKAIERIQKRRYSNFDSRKKYYALFENLKEIIPSKLVVRIDNRNEYIDLKDVCIFQKVDGSAEVVYYDEKRLDVSNNFSELEVVLEERDFAKANSHQIVNLRHVRRISGLKGKGKELLLTNGEKVDLEDNFKSVLIEKLEKYTSKKN
ncbi:MAG: response regulator transcription factor [Bacteroidales bacterium]|nr:response regulator transcription factor [Bacteroidales bacterium]HPD96432.1 LytTR family DNA-binding domain-containing protein [Tenuifilaceae bacterium]HRX32506.1 LytTR family DNA-binding domain-containing protein [Tenuifilaceae bacterium]